jgi:mannitol 2-dehydrogenase
MPRLDAESLATLEIPTPAYDRSKLRTGIVHFGVGGFHRAHQAMYLDTLMNEGSDDNGDAEKAASALHWAICGVGVLPHDRRMHEVMQAQDCLYTLVVKHADGTLEPRVIGSIAEYLFAPDDPQAVVAKMADPATRIVSLTVTEGGYHVHSVTGEFDDRDEAIQHDLQIGKDPDAAPRTTFGFITAALRRRREAGTPAFTVMSCDNIQGNGDVAHKMVSAFARLQDPDLAEWIEREVPFPNSMVDRITPVTADDDRAVLAERFGVEDAWPVVCEPYTQWVLEDHFVDGRPAVDEVGVQVVPDVMPYELMKLRLLNAGHQALCYLGYLSDYRYAHEAAGDELFAEFLLAYMNREATPTLQPVPGVDLEAYKPNLIERFANPEVRDTLARLCAESSDRIPKWLLPVVRQNLADGGEIDRAALVVAAWARYAEGVDEQGEPITVVDRLSERLVATAQRQKDEPLAFISDREVFGDLVDDERFVAVYTEALDSLHTRGARATMEAWRSR